jgi:hypothetical protein
METKETGIEFLQIPKHIMTLKCGYDAKAILAYMSYRINLNDKNFSWTFSRADITKTLHMNKDKVSRFFEELEAAKVISYCGTTTKANLFNTKKYRLNHEEFKRFLVAQNEQPVSQNKQLLAQFEQLVWQNEQLVAQDEHYNNKNKNDENKEKNKEKNNEYNKEKSTEFDLIFGKSGKLNRPPSEYTKEEISDILNHQDSVENIMDIATHVVQHLDSFEMDDLKKANAIIAREINRG